MSLDTKLSTTEFAILGAGAIGSILGAHLARAGHRVIMLARARRAEQIERDGLRLKGLVDCSVEVPVLTDPTRLTSAEVLIVATKTSATAAALEPLQAATIGTAFSIQNGVWKNDQLASVFGAQRVLGALANTSGELQPTGEVLFTRNVNLFLGELGRSDSQSGRASRIAATIDASGVRSTAVDDILNREWTKFVGWVGLMGMSVATRARTGDYLSDPDCALLLVRLVREMSQLAAASGIRLTDQESLLPIRTMLESSDEAAIRAVCAAGEEFSLGAPEHRMSSLQDLEARRPLEIDETLGDAVRRAERLGLSLPLLEAMYRLTAAIDRTNRILAP